MLDSTVVSLRLPKEHPLLLKDRLVRATLDDVKTETRRVGSAAKRWLKAEAGDILWVREAWGVTTANPPRIVFRSDGEEADVEAWRPSIHLARVNARLRLELLEKPWMEPLQDITEDGAMAEGVEARPDDTSLMGLDEYLGAEGEWFGSARYAFASLWDSINVPRGYGWEKNPDVAVLRYRRLP